MADDVHENSAGPSRRIFGLHAALSQHVVVVRNLSRRRVFCRAAKVRLFVAVDASVKTPSGPPATDLTVWLLPPLLPSR